MSGRRPKYKLRVAGPPEDGKKAFWTEIGAAWENEKGFLTLTVNGGLNLLLTKQSRLILVPADERRDGRRTQEVDDDGVPF